MKPHYSTRHKTKASLFLHSSVPQQCSTRYKTKARLPRTSFTSLSYPSHSCYYSQAGREISSRLDKEQSMYTAIHHCCYQLWIHLAAALPQVALPFVTRFCQSLLIEWLSSVGRPRERVETILVIVTKWRGCWSTSCP